jgi:hypothetical protein
MGREREECGRLPLLRVHSSYIRMCQCQCARTHAHRTPGVQAQRWNEHEANGFKSAAGMKMNPATRSQPLQRKC